MSVKQFTCIFFDWDLTLVRVLGDISPEERLTALFQREGLPYTLREVQNAVRCYRADVQAGKIKRPQNQQTQREIARYYQDILARLSHRDRDWERAVHLYNAYAFLPQLPYEETRPVLQTLRTKGVKLGVISNHSRLIRPVIERIVGEAVDPHLIIISQEMGVHKPAGTIFHQAMARAQATAAACIFVGDHLSVDALGAVEKGGFGLGLWLDRQGKENGQTAVLPPNVDRITSLWQVLNYV
ncbi:MAG: HAD family hydrolase [Chloroflexi bacterium]|nr:HAD family hydrolase [Chloroflexota bacterium]